MKMGPLWRPVRRPTGEHSATNHRTMVRGTSVGGDSEAERRETVTGRVIGGHEAESLGHRGQTQAGPEPKSTGQGNRTQLNTKQQNEQKHTIRREAKG